MLLLIDNYDSFTFNLAQYLGELGQDVKVLRNDALDVALDRGFDYFGVLVFRKVINSAFDAELFKIHQLPEVA